jgi:hypothetical protein
MELDLQPRTLSQVSQTGCFFVIFSYEQRSCDVLRPVLPANEPEKTGILAFSAQAGSAAKTYKELRSNFGS